MKYKKRCSNCGGTGWVMQDDQDEKEFCYNCGSITVFKIRTGAWTLIFAILTCGLSLFLLPFYHPRCQHCNIKKY